MISKINGRFGRVGWTPVVYQYRHVPFKSLIALYAVSDVCLVTPLRDGMNLVAKEYVATKADRAGVLILSEMAGAAKELLKPSSSIPTIARKSPAHCAKRWKRRRRSNKSAMG